MNFKKIVSICAMVLNASVLSSQSVPEKKEDQKKYFSGLFLGFHTGYQHLVVKNNYVNTLDVKYFVPEAVGTEYLTAHGSLVGGHVVVSHVFDNNLYFGAEMDLTYNFVQRTSTDEANFNRSFTYAQNEICALFVRVGAVKESVLFYGKAGLSFMNRTITTRFPDLSEYDKFNDINPVEVSKDSIKGFSVGLGCAIPIDANVSLGFETEYTKYESDKNKHTFVQDYVMDASNLKFKISFIVKI